MLPVIAIVGRANVGKSTLFNRLIGQRLSITDDQPGVTRDRIISKSSWLGVEFNLIDTGGIEIDNAPFIREIKQQAEIAIDEADVIVFVVDCRNGVTDEDEAVAKLLFKSNKPVLLAVNKVDDQKYSDTLYEFYSLGIGEPIACSAAHGIGIGDLLDQCVKLFPDKKGPTYEEDTIKFSLIGRPNVGKSSLTNALVGEDRVVVSEIEGTTRDSIDTMFKRDSKEYVVIDTAGIRKKGKVYEQVEKYSVLRAMQAIDRSDICVIVINAHEGIREQDKKIAGYAEEAGRGIIIVVNKWDLVDKDDHTMNNWEKEIRAHFQFISYAPIVFLSAITKKRIHTLFPILEQVHANFSKRIKTNVINDLMIDMQQLQPAPTHNRGKLKILYATQVTTQPPTFVLKVNNPIYLHFSYKRYILNRLRESIDFEGTPVRLIFRERE